MKTYQLETNASHSMRGFFVSDDASNLPKDHRDTFSVDLEGNALKDKQREIALTMLRPLNKRVDIAYGTVGDATGTRHIDEFLGGDLFKLKFWQRGEPINETEIRTSLDIS